MKNKYKILIAAVAVLAIAGFFLIQQYNVQPEPAEEDEMAAVLGYAEPIADNLLQGFTMQNYTMFSRDFDDTMKEAMTYEMFLQTHAFVVTRLGYYLSREVQSVFKEEPYTVVIYNAEFEKEGNVTVKIVFSEQNGKHVVSGLWFSSPKLAE